MQQFSATRYDVPSGWFRKCGKWGLKLPAVSLGCWHNFGDPGTDAARHTSEDAMHENARQMLFTAFDNGITHFDLANNYGPRPGAAESRVGRILSSDFGPFRDELVISTKAGYEMWPGPYGEWGSRKYLLASLDQSLRRLQLDYVDVFYSHRFDPETPMEETMSALDTAVRSGKAIYCGISSYSGEQTMLAVETCARNGFVRPVIHQPRYSMLDRRVEADLLPVLGSTGMGAIAFCPLAQGLLTSKYVQGIPEDSRVRQVQGFLREDRVTPEVVATVSRLQKVAERRGQTLAQMALLWSLRDPRVTSALIGASRPSQIEENIRLLDAGPLSQEELSEIETALTG